MVLFFKKSKKKKPKKGFSFYHRENLIQTISELNTVFSHLDFPESTKSRSNILFQGLELDSILVQNLAENFGEESYLLEPESGIPNHKVYFYRITSEHLRFLIQLHFVDDNFFFAANKIYSSSPLTNTDKQNVIKQISSKYFPDADNNTIEFNITDPKGNILFTYDDMFYYLNYIANNPTFQKLKKQYTGYIDSVAGQEIKETLDRLI